MSESLFIGMAGAGAVGSGVYTLLNDNRALIAQKIGRPIVLKSIYCRHPEKVRSQLGNDCPLTTDIFSLVQDPDIQIVVEVMGGIEPARSFILNALEHGKHVVTANKALLATHGNEIFDKARRCRRQVFFEAAVAGGIPIIKALREGLVANRIDRIAGIVNGTCNFILTAMQKQALSFEQALAQAQQFSYAEADPSFDIEGIDSGHKLSILCSLAFQKRIRFEPSHVLGISKVSLTDVKIAEKLGYRIKLLAVCKTTASDKIEYRVEPTLLPEAHFLAQVDSVMNAVMVHGDAVGTTLYYGAGAGGKATASAVIADIVDASRASDSIGYCFEEAPDFLLPDDSESPYYVRVGNTGLTAKQWQERFSQHQIEVKRLAEVEKSRIWITGPCLLGNLKALCSTLAPEDHPLSILRIENS